MNILDPTYIRDNCDFSFGDQSGMGILGGYMKPANIKNEEFIKKYNELRGIKKYMTLFIDNIRLYYRDNIKNTATENNNQRAFDFKVFRLKELWANNDLLKLCSQLPDMNFVIFTGFEDNCIDDQIFDKIPPNVLAIYASNAISFGGKVHPIPYGVQRKLYIDDYRHEVIKSLLDYEVQPKSLLYINHNTGNNIRRVGINQYFEQFEWATIEAPISISSEVYKRYLLNIKNHKFMICPDGNAIGCECSRDWEVLYMRRVPIVKRSDYLEYMFKDFPVLFVDNFTDVTQELLKSNEYLFQEALAIDINKLDIKFIYDKIINELEKF